MKNVVLPSIPKTKEIQNQDGIIKRHKSQITSTTPYVDGFFLQPTKPDTIVFIGNAMQY